MSVHRPITHGGAPGDGPAGYGARFPSSAIAVTIISDSRLLCEGLPTLLEPFIGLHPVTTYPSEPLPPVQVPYPPGQVILIDSGIGHRLAIEWTHFWRSQPRPVFVLVLELLDDVQTIIDCIEAGACGYTLKTATPEEIADAIRLAHRGGATCSPQVTAQLFARLAALNALSLKSNLPDMPLTPREMQVLRLMAKGYSNREIALELVITLRTVKYHVHNILTKLNQDSRRAAVHLASQRGWLDSRATRLFI